MRMQRPINVIIFIERCCCDPVMTGGVSRGVDVVGEGGVDEEK